jgi:hypothetical protein
MWKISCTIRISARDAGAASVEVAVDEPNQHEVDDANVFGEDKSVWLSMLSTDSEFSWWYRVV